MKAFGMIAFGICVFCILPLSCQQEEKVTPNTGRVTFSLYERERTNGRTNGNVAPAFVVLNIESSNGTQLDEIKVSASSLGSIVIYENPGLPIGRYRLTQLVVYDDSSNVIYASPKAGSEMAKFASRSLPFEFNVNNNNDPQIIVDVLNVYAQDNPELFGYTNSLWNVTGPEGKVKKVVFSDLFIDDAETTMHFEYKHGRVETVRWTFDHDPSGIRKNYTERRFYSANGELDSLAGGQFNGNSWSLSYEYIAGELFRIKSHKNDSIADITFLKYDGPKPALIENLYGIYGIYEGAKYPRYTNFEFDQTGNLVYQQNTDIPGHPAIVQEKITTYNSEPNPLRHLIQTPLPQVMDHFDDVAFFFSTHLPSSVEANYPYVYPENNRITFEYTKDSDGRIIHIKALRTDRSSLRYTLDISYY